MLFIPDKVSRYFHEAYDGIRFYSMVYADDLYRLLPDGSVYIHWMQEGPVEYSRSGAFVGKIKRPERQWPTEPGPIFSKLKRKSKRRLQG